MRQVKYWKQREKTLPLSVFIKSAHKSKTFSETSFTEKVTSSQHLCLQTSSAIKNTLHSERLKYKLLQVPTAATTY